MEVFAFDKTWENNVFNPMAASHSEGSISNFGSKVEYNTEKIKCMYVSIYLECDSTRLCFVKLIFPVGLG